MKTIAKTILAAGILMFALQVYAASPVRPTAKEIVYAVNVIPQENHLNIRLDLFIGIKDENGRLVAPVQHTQKGKLTYYFNEAGPQKGVRTAFIVNDPVIPTNYSFNCAPESISGGFFPGVKYDFYLYPSVTFIKKPVN
jgi:hypothetical protein